MSRMTTKKHAALFTTAVMIPLLALASNMQPTQASFRLQPSRQPAARARKSHRSFHHMVASWYGGWFHGRKTASGEIFDMNKLTAAHKTLPLGTKLLVKNPENGASCV